MSWKIWGEVLKASYYVTLPTIYQPVRFTNDDDQNIVLTAVRTWIIVYNLPTFTNVQMRVYSDQGNQPGQLLFTSTNSYTLAQLTSEDNAAREVYFEFSNAHFNHDDVYHFALWPTGYTDTDGSHLAWKKDFPIPKYQDAVGSHGIAVAPYDMAFIGADL